MPTSTCSLPCGDATAGAELEWCMVSLAALVQMSQDFPRFLAYRPRDARPSHATRKIIARRLCRCLSMIGARAAPERTLEASSFWRRNSAVMVQGTLLSGMSTMVVMPPAAAADVAVSNPAERGADQVLLPVLSAAFGLSCWCCILTAFNDGDRCLISAQLADSGGCNTAMLRIRSTDHLHAIELVKMRTAQRVWRHQPSPSQMTRPGSLMCTWMSTMPGETTRSPKSWTGALEFKAPGRLLSGRSRSPARPRR